MLIGGAPLALVYKSINTMDSMVGYKNDRYLWFGQAAAKLDDAVNYLPARAGPWAFSWRDQPGISDSCMRSPPSATPCVLRSWRTSYGPTGCSVQPVFWPCGPEGRW